LQSSFLIAYAVMYAGGGKLMDVFGTRIGFLAMMLFWSLACASHGLATGFWMLAASRVDYDPTPHRRGYTFRGRGSANAFHHWSTASLSPPTMRCRVTSAGGGKRVDKRS
jgi:hypothetical protein